MFNRLFFIIDGEFHQVCLDELVYLAVHDPVNVRGLVVGTVVFDAAVVEDVGVDLRTPLYLLLASLYLGLCL